MSYPLATTKPKLVTEQHITPIQFEVVPFTQESEEALLGCLLMDPKIFPIIARRVVAEDYFLIRHSYIFRAMENLYKEFQTYDYLTLSDYLRTQNVLEEIGGQAHLTYLVTQVPNTIHAEVYAELVARTATRRRILMATDTMRKLALDESLSLSEVIAKSEKAYSLSVIDFARRQEEYWSDIINVEVDKILDPDKYINDGFQLEFPINNIKFKLQAEEVSVLGGLTGTGKTAFTLWLVLHHLRAGRRVIFISLEMTKRKILYRLVALITGISAEMIENRTYANDYENGDRRTDVLSAMTELAKYEPIFHVIENARSAKAINRAVASLAYSSDVDLVVVDHLKRVNGDKGQQKEYERLESISQEFQAQAKEYKCPYLVLHQLKLPPATHIRKDQTPYSNDLYGGIYVENVVDNVYAIHRDDHSKLDIADAQPGRVDLFVLKDRNGGGNTRQLIGNLRYLGNEQYRKWL